MDDKLTARMVKELRVKKKYTIEEISEAIGIDRTTYSKYEKDYRQLHFYMELAYRWLDKQPVKKYDEGYSSYKRRAMYNERIMRQCLKCESPFMARNKYTRLCVACKRKNEEYEDLGI